MPGDAVVLLHGQPSTAASWLPVRGLLPDVRVVVPDRPGYGDNPLPAADFQGNVDWLLRLLDRAGIGRAVLVGHSWAGGVAVLAAARHPDRVTGLALVSSVGPRCLLWHDHPLAWPVTGPALSYAGLRVARPLLRWRAHAAVGRRLAERDRAGAQASLRTQFARPVWRSFLIEQRALVAQMPTLDSVLPAVAVPTIVLAGRRDRVIPPATPHLLADRIAGARLRVVPAVGHQLPLDAPDAVAHAVLDLLCGRPAVSS